MSKRTVAICLLVLASVHCGGAVAKGETRTVTGLVTRVVDGDTLWLQADGETRPLKVRLSGIDAPEICQNGGAGSREVLKRRLFRQQVTISFQRLDDYGRVLARVEFKGEDVGQWMVSQGQAWSYRYRNYPGPYAAEQAVAERARLGIFAAGNAENPRSFRQRHGSCYP